MSLGCPSRILRASVQAYTIWVCGWLLARNHRVSHLKYGLPLSKTHSPGQRHLYQSFEKGWLTLGWRPRRQHERFEERRSGHLQCTGDRPQLSDEASRGKWLSTIIGGYPRSHRRFFDSPELNVGLGIVFCLVGSKGLENMVQGHPILAPLQGARQ